MIVKLDIDPKLVWQLNDESEQIASTPSRIVGGILSSRYSLKAVPTQDAGLMRTRDAVAHLHAEGCTDVEIAARVDRVLPRVARVRRELGLKPNKRKESNDSRH